ncbi:unnamed protein product [Lymnaea stagnalis]|uniref:BZIP domain-containing protein n=1 Tax=Lymnaea stagnalis TaxID=6523 RepID=A0AAV2HBR2_LYMST
MNPDNTSYADSSSPLYTLGNGKESDNCTNTVNPDFYYQDSNQMMPQLLSDQQNHQAFSTSQSPGLFRLPPGGQFHGLASPALARALSTITSDKNRRPRSEKKPIPDEQKDDKYYERRRRNNEAAKKSRDARKKREDDLAVRATILERKNSILKVQADTMRGETEKLRLLWMTRCQNLAQRQNQANLQPTMSSQIQKNCPN